MESSIKIDADGSMFYFNRCNSVRGDIRLTTDRGGNPGNAYYFSEDTRERMDTVSVHQAHLTIALWYKRTIVDRVMPLVAGWETYYHDHDPGHVNTAQGYQLIINASNQIAFTMSDANAERASICTELGLPDDDYWHHIVFQFNGTLGYEHQYKIYVDGVNQNLILTEHRHRFGEMLQSRDMTYIGFTSDSANREHRLYGYVDDIAFFDRILSENEILALRNSFL